MSRLVGLVKIEFLDLPGSPTKIGQPKLRTTTHLPRSHLIGNLQYLRVRITGASVSPTRIIDCEPAPTAD